MCEGVTWQKIWVGWWLDDDCFLTKRSIRTIRVFLVCYARGPDFRAGGKLLFWAGFAYFCFCIVWRVWFCEKRCFGRLRSCSYSWERIQSSFIKVSLMNALVCMQAEKRRLHAVPSCGSDRLKRHFREGSVAGISHIRKACAAREPWKIRKKRSYDSENRRIFQLVRDLQSLKKRQNSCYRRHLRAHAFFNMGDASNWPLRRALKCVVLEKKSKHISCVFLVLFFTLKKLFRMTNIFSCVQSWGFFKCFRKIQP